MVTACPSESDPKLYVEKFLKDPKDKVLAGLRTEGCRSLMTVVMNEIISQDPTANIIKLDRDILADSKVDFPRELLPFFKNQIKPSVENYILLFDTPEIIGWEQIIPQLAADNVHLLSASSACRQVPICTKLL